MLGWGLADAREALVVSARIITPPRTPPQLAAELAWRAQQLEALALELLQSEASEPPQRRPLRALWARFNHASASFDAAEFADAYAQAVTYGLLAARWLAGDRSKQGFTRERVAALLPAASPVLRELFDRLVNSRFDPKLAALLDELTALLARTPVAAIFAGEPDPSIHFYQDFLDAYNPQLRRDQGVYYTPDPLVRHVVHTAHSTLQEQFGLRLGLADPTSWAEFAGRQGIAVPKGVDGSAPFVQILDPASGTGTFLLAVIELIHGTMMTHYAGLGLAAEPAQRAWVAYVREHLLTRISGFEPMLAPYMVSHLRLALALERTGFGFEGQDRLGIFATHTLDLPAASPRPGLGEELAGELAAVARLKQDAPISVILGNPPYRREAAEDRAAHKGGWVREGWAGWAQGRPLLEDFAEPTRRAGAGGHLKNIYNLYVYFWRWAIWRVFDRFEAPGIVSLITASSYLRGPGFIGMREALRRAADHIYIVDLEGGQRGTRVSDNVFGIATPVCVATLVARRAPDRAAPATTHYRRVSGSGAAKLAQCGAWSRLAQIDWAPGPAGLHAPLLSAGATDYARWPPLTQIWPWQHSGVQFKRTWPIAETPALLRRRWAALLEAPSRAQALRETGARTIAKACKPARAGVDPLPALASLEPGAACPAIVAYGFRSFDRQWALADPRLADRLRAPLWRASGPKQLYLTSLLSGVLGDGPAATVSALVPDLHHFRGSYGGKDVIPLWRDSTGQVANLSAGFCAAWAAALGFVPGPEAVFAYAYAVLANPGYVARFAQELQVPGPRLPVTKDRRLFERGVALGFELLAWHSYGARLRPEQEGFVLRGSAAVLTPIPARPEAYPQAHSYEPLRELLRVGEGEIGPVRAELWGFGVSGLKVLKSWLDYRMQRGAGRRSSPLDALRPARWTAAMTRELLELLWVLEWTVAQYPVLDTWLAELLESELLRASDVGAHARR